MQVGFEYILPSEQPDQVRHLFVTVGIITTKKGWTMIYKEWLGGLVNELH